MKENFLIILSLIWLVVASLQDIKKREIENWISFSLIVFSLAYRAFYAIINSTPSYFVYGLFSLLIFFIFANLFYYARLFAGGDAKLLMALGPALPLSSLFDSILYSSILFIFLILICGSIYSLSYSFILVLTNKRKFVSHFKEQFKRNKKYFAISFLASSLILIFSIFLKVYFINFLVLIFILFPLLYIYAKAIEDSFMILNIKTEKLTIGDWLYKPVKIKGKTIKVNWQGLNEQEIRLIKRYKKRVRIKQGIPFSPTFLFAFIVLLVLRNSSWSFW